MEEKKPYKPFLHPEFLKAGGIKPEQKEVFIHPLTRKLSGMPTEATYNDLHKIEIEKRANQNKPIETDFDKRQAEFYARMEGYKLEASALMEKNKADEEKYIALDTELEKRSNDEYEARKKKRDEDFEKNWGKNKTL